MIFQVKKKAERRKTVYSKCYSLFIDFWRNARLKWHALKISNKEAATAKALEFQKEFEAEAAGIILP